ncbi:MAG: hypothetical protein JWM27_3955 [Gemmatimonadetes bacterium]|nr:hypothetical protein [Gemmatimonadota bacterium]
MSARRPARRLLRMLALATALAACTDGHPLAPKAPAPRADGGVLQWMPMAHATIGTDGPTGTWHLQGTGITIPAGVTARVWVRGGLGISYNPDYDQFCRDGGADGARDCGGLTYNGMSAGPFGLSDGSVATALFADGPDGRKRVPLGVPSNGDGYSVDADVTGPAELMASRSGTGLYFAGVPAYLATGSQEIEVDTLGYANAPGDGGGTGGNPGGGSGTPGDSAGGGCPAGARSGVSGPRLACAPGQTSKLLLECNGKRAPEAVEVERAEQLRCQARSDSPPAMLAVQGWTFRGADFSYPDLVAGDAAETSAAWGGQIVMSGTISVTGTINGAAQSATMEVRVKPREAWHSKEVQVVPTPVDFQQLDEQARPHVPPHGPEDLGRAFFRPIGGFDVRSDPQQAARVLGFVADYGPNHGLAYLKDVPLTVVAQVYVSESLTQHGDFWRAQAEQSNAMIGPPRCVRSAFGSYVELAKQHEGFDGNPHSHVGYYVAALNPAAALAVEDIVYRNTLLDAMARAVSDRLKPIAEAANRRTAEVDRDYPVHFGCSFNFDSPGR